MLLNIYTVWTVYTIVWVIVWIIVVRYRDKEIDELHDNLKKLSDEYDELKEKYDKLEGKYEERCMMSQQNSDKQV